MGCARRLCASALYACARTWACLRLDVACWLPVRAQRQVAALEARVAELEAENRALRKA